jgi:putative membrane-bound dehydrogenase-like protein
MVFRRLVSLTCIGVVAWLSAPRQYSAFGQQADKPAIAKSNPAPLAPIDALRSFELHQDFRIELVASEPLVEDPVAMAFDERGNLFVVEYPEFNEYQFPRGKKRSGRVKRLRDTDNDGRYDKSTVFVEVPFATAVICFDGGVFVGAPPDVLYCKDTTGDGVADQKRVVLTGFGRDFAGGGLLNSFCWGLDNRIHIATGFAGGRVRQPDQDESKAIDVRGRGLILDPRTNYVEPTSGGGQHGMSMDDWGNKFLCSNVYPLQMLVFDDRYAVRNPFFAPRSATRDINAEDRLAPLKRISPLERWRVVRSLRNLGNRRDDEANRASGVFTSASGITVYRGDALPKEFYGHLFVGEVANNLVYRAKVEQRGVEQVALRADREAEFLASKDTWFRPVQFANGPDGALYVVDMYRQLIEGAAFVPPDSLAKLDPSLGIDRGRIYRVVPKSFEHKSWSDLDQLTTRQLVRHLTHTNGWHRETAARLLYQRNDPTSIESLKKISLQSKSPQGRILALYSLASQNALDREFLLQVHRDSNPRVSEHAIRLTEPYLESSPELREAVYAKVSDPNIRVRYQVAFSLGQIRGSRRNSALATLAWRDADNPWMLLAVQSSLFSGVGDVFSKLISNQKPLKNEPIRQFLFSLAAQIGLQNDASEVAALLKSLNSLTKGDREDIESIQRTMFAGIRREKLKSLGRLGGPTDVMFENLVGQARKLAVDESKSMARRTQAVRTLGLVEFDDTTLQQIFQRLLSRQQPGPIQSAACETMARFDHPRVAELLLERWPNMTPSLRRQTVETLFSRPSWIARFLDSVAANEVSRHDIDLARIRLLEMQANVAVRSRIRRLFPKSQRVDRQSIIATFEEALKHSGDEARGKMVFQKACAACHTRKSIGKAVGPDLNDTDRRPKETLLIDILDPNRHLKPLFQNYVVRTGDGRVFAGMIIKETANGIQLQQPNGTTKEILRIKITEIKGTGISFMPEGIEKTITKQAMADLLAFLHS